MANNEKRDSVPWSLLITLVAVLLTFFIVMPIMGYMYIDLLNVRAAMVVELKKAQKVRRQLEERLYEQ